MMPVTLQTALMFALTSAAIEVTPGPNMTYLALVSLRSGRRAGFAAVAGVALGLEIVGLAMAFGLSEALAGWPIAFTFLRWGGIAFLFYLAWEAWRQGGDSTDTEIETSGGYFRKALITNLLNPKAAVFYLAVLPSFLDPNRTPIVQTVFLSTLYVAVATIIHSIIVGSAAAMQPLLTNQRSMARSGKVFGLALVVVALWVAWETR